MRAQPGCLPLDWVINLKEVAQLRDLAAMYVWDRTIEAGHNPAELIRKTLEVGDGSLAVGLFLNETDDFQKPVIGFVIPLGFWWTTDNRMPKNWIFKDPPPNYGRPGVGTPDTSFVGSLPFRPG